MKSNHHLLHHQSLLIHHHCILPFRQVRCAQGLRGALQLGELRFRTLQAPTRVFLASKGEFSPPPPEKMEGMSSPKKIGTRFFFFKEGNGVIFQLSNFQENSN